jgi:hypothetical protein
VARGLAYAKAEAYEDALNDFARAIELEPRTATAFAYRAWTYRRQQPELGLKEAERALKLDPNSAEVYWARGEIHEAQGRGTLAVADFEKALALDPEQKWATRALQRLGVLQPAFEEDVAGAGVDSWRVFAKGRQFVALSDQYPRLRIDIEMLGKGQPRLLEWELKTAPFAGIGVLRFHAGVVEGPRGAEPVEQVAIVDVQANAVMAVEVHRRGAKEARMTWEGGKLIMASADGTTDEIVLRPDKAKEQVAAKRIDKARQKTGWSPWGSTWDSRRGRPKTLFELLFGN